MTRRLPARAQFEGDWTPCHEGQAEEAIQACTRLIQRQPMEAWKLAKALCQPRPCLCGQGQFAKAIDDYSKAIEIETTTFGPTTIAGSPTLAPATTDRALADYGKALSSTAPMPGSIKTAATLCPKGNVDRALQDFTKAIELAPENASAYNERGEIYAKKGDTERAMQDFAKAIALEPDDTWAYTNRGDLHADKRRYDQAIADFTKAIEVDATNVWAVNNRAWAHLNSGKANQALADANRALELSPDSADFLNTRGHILEVMGRRRQAIADLRQAIAKDPTIQGGKAALKRLGALR